MNSTVATNDAPGMNGNLLASKATDWPAVPTVFFDGACPLCRREIAHYRRLRDADRLAWVDISSDESTLIAHGLTRQAAIERLHVLDAAGYWHTGAWAFAELWSHLPRYRLLAELLRRTGVLPMLDRVYMRFARWRMKKQAYAGACAPAMAGSPSACTIASRSAKSARVEQTSLTAGERSCV